MTRFAFGEKWGSPTSPPVFGSVAVSAANPSFVSSTANAGMPIAIPTVFRWKNRRRVIAVAALISGVNESLILCLAFGYSAVIVSSRLRIMLANVVHAATSRESKLESILDSPIDSSLLAWAWSCR